MSYKITRTIHHGDYHKVVTGEGPTILDALMTLPITTYDTRPAQERATAIEDHRRTPGYPGPYQWGWCDYRIEDTEEN